MRYPNTGASSLPRLGGHGKLWLWLKYRLRWPGKKSLREMLSNYYPGAVCLKRTSFVVVVTEQRGDWKIDWQGAGTGGDVKIGLPLTGRFSSTQHIYTYPRANREMMGKNRGWGTGRARAGLSLPRTCLRPTHPPLRHAPACTPF